MALMLLRRGTVQNEASALCGCRAGANGPLLICTLTAGWQKAFSPMRKSASAIANKFRAMIDSGNIPPQYTGIAARAVGIQ